ncbi:hypothetical protein SEUCBS139899_010666 [Sporothrix eucalyptigena]|uniref:H/ACA ribonucleoprotein complex non-core subunit NAF1 n=1 Tax=Sporothrix eucalyptigena TaxID=1812306 RepID=A0ABP0CD78_9PEZI
MLDTTPAPEVLPPAADTVADADKTETAAPAEQNAPIQPSQTTQTDVETHFPTDEQPVEAPAPETASSGDVMIVEPDAAVSNETNAPTEETAEAAPTSTEIENTEMGGTQEESSNSDASAQPHVTDALEAMLSGSMDVDTATTTAEAQTVAADTDGQIILPTDGPTAETAEGEGVDWEVDSSPYESSSSDSDSSDDSDDDEGSDADMLGVQETVRMLMESAMQDSDDDEDGGNRGGGNIRSKNEEPETAPPKPEVEIGADDEIVLLGPILHIVESSAVIQGNTDGAYRVLDAGSVLCKADRTVVGVVADVIGNVRSPMYVLRFAQISDLVKDGLEQGQDLFYPTKHAQFVFTEELRNIKGSDASNLHDEEIGADEAEFSDDEKEAAHKRELKARRRGGGAAGGNDRNGAQGASGKRGQNKGHPLRNEVSNGASGSGGLKYDDDEDDGPYKPLTRPANFGQGSSLPPVPPPSVNANNAGGASSYTNNGSFRGQSRFNRGGSGFGGGRGNRGGGFRGGRGGSYDNRGGRGGWNGGNRNNNNSGSSTSNYSNKNQQSQYNYNQSAPPPPPPQQYQQQQSSAPVPVAPWPFAGMPFPPPPPPPAGGAAPNSASMAAAAALLNNVQIQQILQQHQQQQQRQQAPAAAPAWPGMPAAPTQQTPYQFQYQQPAQPPQQQQQQQQAPPAFNPASFQYLFQGGQQGQPPPPPPPGWGQQPPS